MRNLTFIIAAAGLSISSGAAQTGSSAGSPVRHFAGSAGITAASGQPVTGKPFSATEERRRVQILGDGTRIEKTETDKFYRDDKGSIRIQHPDGSGMIRDAAQGIPDQIAANGAVLHNLPARYDGTPPAVDAEQGKNAKPPVDVQEEDLGDAPVNGVTAHGTRTTTTIPAGQVGSDRPIRIVFERWYSPALQVDVKTVSSDPRNGETFYQLTNIQEGPQDPTLFRHPTPGHQ